MSFGSSWPSYLPPSSIAFCATCASVMLRPLPDTLPSATLVAVRAAAERLGGDLLQLLDRVGRRRMRRARVRVRRLAAARHAGPRQVLGRVAPGHDHLLPRHAHHLGGDAVHIAERLGAEVADAGLDVHPAVRLDDEQPVEPGRAGDERAHGHADAAHLRADALAGCALRSSQLNSSAPLSSASLTNALVQYRTLAARVRRTERRFALRRVDAADGDLIDRRACAPPSRGPARSACDPACRRAGSARGAAACWSGRSRPRPHRQRLIHQRHDAARLPGVAVRLVGAVVGDRRTCRAPRSGRPCRSRPSRGRAAPGGRRRCSAPPRA